MLDAFNKDRASIPQPNTTPQVTPLPPPPPPDARTQELINEKLSKAEALGMFHTIFVYKAYICVMIVTKILKFFLVPARFEFTHSIS